MRHAPPQRPSSPCMHVLIRRPISLSPFPTGAARAAATAEFAALRAQVGAGLGESPLELDYRPDEIEISLAEARRRLSEAAEAVSKDWWVPQSYDPLHACAHHGAPLPPFPPGGCPRATSASRRWCVPSATRRHSSAPSPF